MVFESFAESLSFFLWSTLVISIILGIVVSKTNFCTMGAVSDMVNMNDYSRFRMWLLAIAVATIGVTLLEYLGMVNVNDTFPPYRGNRFVFAENILGGILFGIGMTYASGCGNKALVRIGGGNIKSIIVFITLALVAYYMINPFPDSDKTLYSVLFYDWLSPLAITLDHKQDIGAVINGIVGGDNPQTLRLVLGLVFVTALLFYIFKDAEFKNNKDNLLGGIIIGLAILSAWYISSNIIVFADDTNYSLLQYHEEWDMLAEDDVGKPASARTLSPQSFTFVNPIGQSFGYIKSGFDAALITFGLTSVFGIILGSLFWSLVSKSFRIEWFVDVKDFVNHFIGAILMGVGAVLALGCTVGQGITGISTLALGSMITLIAIIFGSALTMKIQYYKIVYEEEASFGKAFVTSLVDMKLLPASMRKLDAV